MKIHVDQRRCEGYGLCENAAPTLLHLDESGVLVLDQDGEEVPEGLQKSAEAAVRICPVAALTLRR